MQELYELEKDKQKKVMSLLKQDTGFRYKFFENRLYSFALYYFPHFFNIKSSEYHKIIAKDLLKDNNIMLLAFREFGKSIWILVYIIHGIVYKKFNFLLYFSYEQRLSASRLFDIIVQLKTNQLLIRDYGKMFPDNSHKEDDGLQKKSVSEFITTNQIKLKSMSIGTTARGLLYSNKVGAYRPDIVVGDDLDTIDSVRNPEIINKNEEFLLNEVIGGVDNECKITFLGNIIGPDGLVPRFEKRAKENKNWILHKIPIKINGNIVWDRFVETEQEAEEFKKQGIKKISIEKKKLEQGEAYSANFELIPNIRIGNPVFNIETIQNTACIEFKTDTRYKQLRIYKQPQETVFGVDSATGSIGSDYSTIVGYNQNKELVLTLQIRLAPDLLGEAMEYIFSLGYKGLIVPENNSIGISLIDKLKNGICRDSLYFEKSIDSITQRAKKKFGFNTNAKSKPLIISNLEKCIRTGEVKEFDERTKEDLISYYYDDKGATNALNGKYDDLVIATALSLHGLDIPKQIVFG